jgi:hypothetical protein
VGAGAVGSGFDFFVSFFGHHDDWLIVDDDAVDVSNLNRQLAFVAADAGFPEGPPTNKAERAAELLGSNVRSSPGWFGDDPDAVNAQYDVVLALANERGVRSFLQGRQPTVLLHATTSPNWQAQFHRHVAGTDDCIDCRLPPEMPRFTCDVEEVETQAGEKVDAAVPPLSALAALSLAAKAARLQSGVLLDTPHNFVAVEVFGGAPAFQAKARRCREGCMTRRPPDLRRAIDAQSRWLHLDSK